MVCNSNGEERGEEKLLNRKPFHFICGAFGALAAVSVLAAAQSVEAPRIEHKGDRYALMVEGKPYLALGGQIHNSSAWPSELPQVWASMEALHANTIEAPAYWEQIEPVEGQFDFSNVDALIEGARAHNLHMVLLWFGTWKNGNAHYVPTWVKQDAKKYPRTIRPDGEPIDVLSPLGKATLEADKKAFVALTKHLKQVDGDKHTIIAIQVENESGNVGSDRDHSPEANKLFAAQVPGEALKATGKQTAGTWAEVYKGEADEVFQAYYQAKYINEIAAAGKQEFNIPFYINVWLDYPVAQLAQRQLDQPGVGYPSGGPVQKRVGMWRALATSIDMVGPDIYADDSPWYREIIKTYHRADNPLWIPETGRSDEYSKFFFYALGNGALGFAPFGVDRTGWNITGDASWNGHAENFALVKPWADVLAGLIFEGKVKSSVEEPGSSSEEVSLNGWQATVAFGFPQADGRRAPGTKDAHGAALIAQTGADEFVLMGKDASVIFHLPGKLPWQHSEFLTAEEGAYVNGVWKTDRLLNGDETDRGICFFGAHGKLVRVRMNRF